MKNELIIELFDKYIFYLSRSLKTEDRYCKKLSLELSNCYKEMLEEKLNCTLNNDLIEKMRKELNNSE